MWLEVQIDPNILAFWLYFEKKKMLLIVILEL